MHLIALLGPPTAKPSETIRGDLEDLASRFKPLCRTGPSEKTLRGRHEAFKGRYRLLDVPWVP